MSEEWRPAAPGYEVSSWGRVRSLTRQRRRLSKAGRWFCDTVAGRLLRPGHNGLGYARVWLQGRTREYLHRLVAAAFLPRELGRDEVNHKDGNPRNNHVDNLEWCTSSENKLHAYRTGLRKPTKRP